jgi:hypothetical protein
MTATSASNASEPATADYANIRLPGSQRTYAARETLKGLGLRWDPASHAWHGTLPAARTALLERQFGLRPQLVTPIEAFVTTAQAAPAIPNPKGPSPPREPALPLRRTLRDGSRTRAEARVALPDLDDDADGFDGRRFGVLDITAGLPDDSREADERAAERHLRDLRGRVKAARAALSAHPGAQEALRADWRQEAAFLARFGITQAQLHFGVPSAVASAPEDLRETPRSPCDGLGEWQARAAATFPG